MSPQEKQRRLTDLFAAANRYSASAARLQRAGSHHAARQAHASALHCRATIKAILTEKDTARG